MQVNKTALQPIATIPTSNASTRPQSLTPITPAGPVEFDTSRSDGQHKKTVSIGKLRRYLPHYRFTPLRDAVQRTVDWLAENYDSARL